MRKVLTPVSVMLVLLVALGLPAGGVAAATITVNTTGDAALTDGKCSLREAITNANSNSDTTGGDCAAGSPGADTVSLTGLNGTITTVPLWLGGNGPLPLITDELTISGPGAGTLTIDANGNGRVFLVLSTTAAITDLTLTGVAANSSFEGAIVTYNGGRLTVENSTISGNSTGFYGAGINSFFDSGGSVTVRNSTISGNSGSGGGIASGEPLTITDSTISGNTGGIGAGIINNHLGVIRNSTISGNSGGSGGGILNNGDLTIENSTISGNSASQGAGIYSDAPLTIRNSTISGNSASQVGGGIIGGVLIENSTVSGNSAALFGGGIYGGASKLRNTIVAGQLAGGNCYGTIIDDGGYNLEDGTSCGLSTVNNSLPSTNPLLDPAGLKNNGGPTQTIALTAGSPAIDPIPSGVNGCGTTVTSDQRGTVRPQGPGCDIGAFELVPDLVPDTTPPTAAPTQTPAASLAGWNTTDVTVAWNWSDTGGSGIDPANCTTSSTSSREGTITLTATCKDLATNVGNASYTAKVDKTKPTLAPVVSPNPVVLYGSAGVSPGAADAVSGVASSSCGGLSTSTVGLKSVTCTATDTAGNSNSATASYTVVFGFGGFLAPLPKSTLAKSGSVIPVKFRLVGINAAQAATLATKTILAGPSITPQSAPCVWDTVNLFFQCNIKTPKGLQTGNPGYTITVYENVGGGFEQIPQVGSAVNPETVYFK